MKPIGFIKEYDPHAGSMGLDDYLLNSEEIRRARLKIIEYLKKGVSVSTIMGARVDFETGELIGGIDYLTDGEWLWPEYLVYYLERKPAFTIPRVFFEYLMERKFIFRAIMIDKEQMESELIELLGFR